MRAGIVCSPGGAAHAAHLGARLRQINKKRLDERIFPLVTTDDRKAQQTLQPAPQYDDITLLVLKRR